MKFLPRVIERLLPWRAEMPPALVRHLADERIPVRLIYSGVPWRTTDGQRPVRLAQEFVRKGARCVFLFSHHGWEKLVPEEAERGVFVVPLAEALRWYRPLLREISRHVDSLVLIEHPEEAALTILKEAKRVGLPVIYERLDDWADFRREGLAPWFDERVENELIAQSDAVACVSEVLRSLTPGRPPLIPERPPLIPERPPLIPERSRRALIPNGYAPALLGRLPPRAAPDLRRLSIGCFGWLHRARVDWPLLVQLARENPDWTLYFAGAGHSRLAALTWPSNMRLLGTIHPSELAKHVAGWDVCLVPYRDAPLTRACDPIKVYEYLWLHRPVVATGVPHLAESPSVWCSANDARALAEAIRAAAKSGVDVAAVEAFLRNQTWSDRAAAIEKLACG